MEGWKSFIKLPSDCQALPYDYYLNNKKLLLLFSRNSQELSGNVCCHDSCPLHQRVTCAIWPLNNLCLPEPVHQLLPSWKEKPPHFMQVHFFEMYLILQGKDDLNSTHFILF